MTRWQMNYRKVVLWLIYLLPYMFTLAVIMSTGGSLIDVMMAIFFSIGAGFAVIGYLFIAFKADGWAKSKDK